MFFRRIFVTVVVFMASVSVGCSGGKKAVDRSSASALKAEGNEKLNQAEELVQDLAKNYRILILDYPHKLPDGSMADSRRYGALYNWKRLKTPAERQAPKEKLAQLITLLSRVMEIDAKKGIYVEFKDKVQSRYDGALAFQASLNQLEKIYGENKEFSGSSTENVYLPPIEL